MGIVVAGAVLLYLASPNQQLTRKATASRWVRWMGLTGLGAGLAILLQWAGPATAVFILLTAVMLVWTLVPIGAAWLRGPKERGK